MPAAMDEGLSAQEKVWDDWLSEKRVGRTHHDAHYEQRVHAVLQALAALPAQATRKILEVGCGSGDDSVRFAQHGKVVATDLGSATIADAAARFSDSGVRFVAGDFLELTFPEAPFDVIVTLETLSHVYDQAKFVRRCAELLVPGGTLVITTQNRDVYDFLGYGPPQGYLRRWLNKAELVRLLSPEFDVRSVHTIAPPDAGKLKPALDGRRPPKLLHLAYSYRVDRLVRRVLPGRWLDAIRERAGLARTLVAVAARR
jgi:SAM-dependent methyltransferase